MKSSQGTISRQFPVFCAFFKLARRLSISSLDMSVMKKRSRLKKMKWRTNRNVTINKTRRNRLLEDTQNVLIVENQVVLVVDLDLISAEARDEHSTLSRVAHTMHLSPFFTLQGMRLPFSVYLPGPTAMTYPSRSHQAMNLALVGVWACCLQEAECHQRSTVHLICREAYLRDGNDLLQENAISKGNELGSQRLVCSFTPHNSYHHKYRRIETEFAPQKERNVLDAIGETGKGPSPQIGVIISPIRPNWCLLRVWLCRKGRCAYTLCTMGSVE